MELNGRQRQQFQQALLSAFPSKARLAQMLSFELDWELDAIAGGQNQTEIIFNLINHAKANGQLSQLLTAATSANPGNPALQDFAQPFDTPTPPPSTPEASAPANSSTFNQTNSGGINFQNNITGGQVIQGQTITINNSPSTPRQPVATNAASTKTILFLAANPTDTARLRLDQELREISESLRRCKKRDRFTLHSQGALRHRDFHRALLDHNPQIIHFSGHGLGSDPSAPQGLVFEDEQGLAQLMPTEQLSNIFKVFSGQIECVLLNACYSWNQVEAIAQHIPHVIGMKKAIKDKAAIEFAIAFYDALGNGRSINFAFKLACAQLTSWGEQEVPVLMS